MAIQDDGEGFVPSADAAAEGIGILSMRERTRQCGGTLEIQSSPGRGTIVNVMIPLTGSDNINAILTQHQYDLPSDSDASSAQRRGAC